MKAALPHNEVERLSALRGLDILDTEPEEVFDRITRLAALIMDVPVVLVSFVDSERQWFKSKVGLDVSETHRDYAFCSHAVLSDEVLHVPNTLKDPRFADNPLVTGNPDIRFYAGAPLIFDDGVRLGTLCAIDTKPRELTEEQLTGLRDLAAVVVDELALRQSLKELAVVSGVLETSVVELEHANLALKQFAYMASHDLRAPLKRLVNLVDIALIDTDGAVSDLVEPIRSSAAHLEDLVSGYGRLAGLERGQTEEHMVSELVAQASADSDFDVEIDLRTDARVNCDPVLMTQMMVNLLENVQKYGAGHEVVIDASDTGDSISISVSNAVDETFSVDRSIFAPFRRLVAEGEGDGLGLAIVERIARLHGGSAAANCSGNTFTIDLLLAKHESQ